ncbi:MAG: biotin--[acetyl-CoA-carboxylase] ligase [Flavobacteriaceae bacterium]
MHMIKLDATASTNAYLKDLWQDEKPEDETIVWASHQFGGRGQQGTEWHSEAGKNLTFSVLKYFDGLKAQHQFVLNMAVSLAIHEALNELKIPKISIKWPNDILSGTYKICGILIENMVKSKEIRASVIGIGVNVNQEDFGSIEKAGSLRLITGLSYDLDSLISLIMKYIHMRLKNFTTDNYLDIKAAYEKLLYRMGIPSTFLLPDGTKFNGIIRGITGSGQLKLETEQGNRVFDLKEIRLLN